MVQGRMGSGGKIHPSLNSPLHKIPGKRGFTLFELVVVLFILSLLLAVVIPSFSTSGGRLKSEAREVASVIRYLNDAAAMRKTALSLSFDFKNRSLSWEEEGRGRTERIESLVSVTLPTRGEVTEGELIVFFSPLGLAEHMDVRLALGEEEMTVSFNPISRRTKIRADEE